MKRKSPRTYQSYSLPLVSKASPRIWNSLPNDIKNAPAFSIFKRVIKPFLRVRQNAT